jgi:VPS28 protein
MLSLLLLFMRKRYSPACTRLLSQYKTMLKLVGDDVPSIEEFMTQHRVRAIPSSPAYSSLLDVVLSFAIAIISKIEFELTAEQYRWTTLPHYTDYK